MNKKSISRNIFLFDIEMNNSKKKENEKNHFVSIKTSSKKDEKSYTSDQYLKKLPPKTEQKK